MLIAIVILSLVCVVLGVRLILLKGAIRELTKDFKESRSNLKGEQHVQLFSPDKDLEKLAGECNQYVRAYFETQYQYQKEVASIRSEIMNLSHDLRTPITSILGYVDLLLEEELTKEQEESMEVVKRRSEDLNSLIEQLYDYVRLENKEMVIENHKLDLFKILREHLLSFYHEFEHKGIELIIDFPKKEEPVWIQGDYNCIERVLINMTSNTIKYCEGHVFVSLHCNEKEVSVSYQTQRGGLTDYDIGHLFDRFYRKDMVRKGTRSSGLGLTIAKLYIEQMNGEIHAWGKDDCLFIQFKFTRILE